MLLLNLLLALAWAALTGVFSPVNLAFGFVLGYAMLWPFRRQLGGERYFETVPETIRFVLYFLKELVRANLKVARMVLFTPVDQIRPGVIGVPLDLEHNTAITMLANVITLTPGTLSLDVSDDRRTLYVHSIEVTDPHQFRASIKGGFERLIRELFI